MTSLGISLGILGLSAALALPVAVGLGPPESIFAPAQCSFRVAFPVEPSLTKSTAADGGEDTAADLVRGAARLSAACLGAPPGQPARHLAEADAKAQMILMMRALGLQTATIRPLPALGADCGEVESALGDGNGAYRIAARLCIQTGATFIAEVVYRSDQGLDDAAKAFLASLSTR